MSDDLQRAKQLLEQGNYTCVLCRGELTYQTKERGIAPLLRWLDSDADTWACAAADKVVGKAAAHLYCLLGIRCVYGKVFSAAAVKLLRRNGIGIYWGTLAEAIRDRAGTGLCPMEIATASIDEPEEALPVIRATLARLQGK